MRAPPEAATQMKGVLFWMAARTPRTKRSPTTEPMEPPMKSNSKQASTTGTVQMLPLMTTSASDSPDFCVASASRSGYLRLSLNLSGSVERIPSPISTRPSVSSSASIRARAFKRIWWPHLGHTFTVSTRSSLYSTDSQDGHLTHRPSGTRRPCCSVFLLMRGGRILSNQLIVNPYF